MHLMDGDKVQDFLKFLVAAAASSNAGIDFDFKRQRKAFFLDQMQVFKPVDRWANVVRRQSIDVLPAGRQQKKDRLGFDMVLPKKNGFFQRADAELFYILLQTNVRDFQKSVAVGVSFQDRDELRFAGMLFYRSQIMSYVFQIYNSFCIIIHFRMRLISSKHLRLSAASFAVFRYRRALILMAAASWIFSLPSSISRILSASMRVLSTIF